MRLRFKVGIVFLILGSVFLLGRCGRRPTDSKSILPTVLPSQDKEVISVNENRHTITVTTAKGTTQQYSRNPSVEIRKDGTVKVDTHVWGTEIRPFLGAGYSDTGRVYTGCQFLYYRQFDAAASFGWTADGSKPAFQPMLSLSWNFWSNTSLNVGANPVPFVLHEKPEIAVFFSVRL